MTGALPGSAFQRVNNMLPGSEGAKPPIAVPSSLWSGFLTSRLCSWKRQELTVVKQRRRVTSETTCVKNSRPKCCVCCQRPPMARPSTARATQVSCPTEKNTCVFLRQFDQTGFVLKERTLKTTTTKRDRSVNVTLYYISFLFSLGVLHMRTSCSLEMGSRGFMFKKKWYKPRFGVF